MRVKKNNGHGKCGAHVRDGTVISFPKSKALAAALLGVIVVRGESNVSPFAAAGVPLPKLLRFLAGIGLGVMLQNSDRLNGNDEGVCGTGVRITAEGREARAVGGVMGGRRLRVVSLRGLPAK